ncbi:hypothetical protein [Nostoc sp.]|uniref:hypothetical protein n=1 Tax=Nostoc sp. TaxID=1180 RepID=UPI002FF6F8EB
MASSFGRRLALSVPLRGSKQATRNVSKSCHAVGAASCREGFTLPYRNRREPPTFGEADANAQRLIKKTATPSSLRAYAALYLSEAMIAALQLLADTPEKGKIVVLGAIEKIEKTIALVAPASWRNSAIESLDFRRCWKD